MFKILKEAYSDYKEERELNKNLKQDLKLRDEQYRKEAKKEARHEFEEERKKALEHRKMCMLAQERNKYDSKRKKLYDTRTKQQKFKQGITKLGNIASKVGSDTGKTGKSFGNFASMMGTKVSNNLGIDKKKESFADRIRRNI